MVNSWIVRPVDLRLTSVHCTTAEPRRVAPVFDAIGAVVARHDGSVVADVGNATIVYRRADGTSSGVVGIQLTGGIRLGDRNLAVSGLRVTVTSGARRDDPDDAAIRLDHLAIGVADLAAAGQDWASITGAPPEPMDVHPASDGSFSATRFVLGRQMIELVSPVPGVDSPMARRIARHGDGPVAVALPARDLHGAIDRLAAIGVDVLHTDQHVMLHPCDTGGVLVQLTPRLAH